ncbi:MAG: phenylacetate--CoA ligase [Ruminococcaceae bacterium]|nr:phenylacetate--CoA ligase [Oscillospiraceae bacterium]
MMFWQQEIETMDRADLERLQLKKLKNLVDYCYNRVPFYKKRLDEVGITADKITALSDIQHIPYTTKDDIRDTYPFGLFAVDKREIVRIHASSGTTGNPTVVGYTKNDMQMWTDCVSRLVVAAGATADDIVQIAFGYGLFTGALGLHYGLEQIGATVVPTSTGNTEKQLKLMRDFGTTALVSTPSYALYIAEVAKDMGIDCRELNIRLGLFGSEGCSNEMRAKVEEAWNLFATDNYGMSELCGPGVSGECRYRCGMHFAEDHFLPEIIDSATGAVKARGDEGELVVTTLSKEGIPLLRYRTKDISRIHYEKCECGRTHARMEKPLGRADDMLKIKGVNVFPTQIESVLVSIPEVGPQYQIVLGTKNYMDTFEINIEVSDPSVLTSYRDLENLQLKVRHKLQTVLGLDAKINLVEPKSLERFVGKAKRVIDNRQK